MRLNQFVNYIYIHTFNKLSSLPQLTRNGQSTNSNRQANCRLAGTDCKARIYEAYCGCTRRLYEAFKKSAGQKASRRSLFSRKAFLQFNRESTETRGKERIKMLSLPFFLTDYYTIVILNSIDDFCFQINPSLMSWFIGAFFH